MTEDTISEPVADSGSGDTATDRPTILTDDRRLQDITSEALDSLLESRVGPEIFQRGGFLCRLKEKQPGKLIVENINDAIL
jgi:hypothetical protein